MRSDSIYICYNISSERCYEIVNLWIMYHYLSLNLKQQENKKFNQLIIIPTYLFTLALALEFKGKKNKKKFTETTLRFDSQKEKRKKERLILFLFFFFFFGRVKRRG